MRATAGSVSARFQELRLPAGAGLGGLVAQTRRPYWTSDYPADERYAHTSEIDGAVEEEGLVAICGTPLLVDGEFVGVLFAANRARRPFHRTEVALLGSLAALAAVSLLQSRRAAETAAALAELSDAHAAIQEAAQAHDRFTHVVLSGGGVDDIAAVLGGLLGCWVAVLDADGQRIAAHGTVPDVDLGRIGSGAALGGDRAARRRRRVRRRCRAGRGAPPGHRRPRCRGPRRRPGAHRRAGRDGDGAGPALPAARRRVGPARAHRPARRPARPARRGAGRRARRARAAAGAAPAAPARARRGPQPVPGGGAGRDGRRRRARAGEHARRRTRGRRAGKRCIGGGGCRRRRRSDGHRRRGRPGGARRRPAGRGGGGPAHRHRAGRARAGAPARPASWGSPGWSAAPPMSTATCAVCSARCSTTTPPAAPT